MIEEVKLIQFTCRNKLMVKISQIKNKSENMR